MTSVRGGRAIDTQPQVIVLSLTTDMVMFVSHLETLSRLDGNDSGTGGNMPAVLSPYVWVRAWVPQRTDIVSLRTRQIACDSFALAVVSSLVRRNSLVQGSCAVGCRITDDLMNSWTL